MIYDDHVCMVAQLHPVLESLALMLDILLFILVFFFIFMISKSKQIGHWSSLLSSWTLGISAIFRRRSSFSSLCSLVLCKLYFIYFNIYI
jgi:hypothetical protein